MNVLVPVKPTLPAPATVTVGVRVVSIPPLKAPENARSPDKAVKRWSVPSAVSRPQMLGLPAPAALVTSPVRLTALPPIVQPPVVKVTSLRFRPARSFMLSWRVEPEKVTLSPLVGVTPPTQFWPVLQRSSGPAPDHTLVVAPPGVYTRKSSSYPAALALGRYSAPRAPVRAFVHRPELAPSCVVPYPVTWPATRITGQR